MTLRSRHLGGISIASLKSQARQLASVVETKSSDVWVDHAEVKWGVDLINIGQSDEDGTVDGWVTLEGLGICGRD